MYLGNIKSVRINRLALQGSHKWSTKGARDFAVGYCRVVWPQEGDGGGPVSTGVATKAMDLPDVPYINGYSDASAGSHIAAPPPEHSEPRSQSKRPRRVPYPDAALVRRQRGRVG